MYNSDNYSAPALPVFQEYILQQLFQCLAVYMLPLPKNPETIRSEIVAWIKKMNPKTIMISSRSSQDRTLFLEVLKLAEMNGSNALEKLEEVFAIFKVALPNMQWYRFVLSGLKENLPFIRLQHWHPFFIARICELIYGQYISPKKNKLANFLRSVNFMTLAQAIESDIPLKTSAAVDLVFQDEVLNLDVIRAAFADAEKEPAGFVNLFVKLSVLKNLKTKLDKVDPEFSKIFFKEKLLTVRDNGKSVYDQAVALHRHDLIKFLIVACELDPQQFELPKENLESKAEQPKKLNAAAPIFYMPEPKTIESSDQTEAFLGYIFIYLEQMKIDLMAFQTRSEQYNGDKIFIEELLSELLSLVFDLVKENPSVNLSSDLAESRKDLSLGPAKLWSQFNDSTGKQRSTQKLRAVKALLGYEPNLRTFPYNMWNFFLSLHIQSLEFLQKFPHDLQLSSTETTKPMLSMLIKKLSGSFLPAREETLGEKQNRQMIFGFAAEITKELGRLNLGHCGETLKYGINIATFLHNQSTDIFDQTTYIWTDLSSQASLDELKTVIENFLSKHLNLILDEKQLSIDRFSLRFTLNGKVFDWSFSTRPFKDLQSELVFPILSLAYNLEKRTIFNLANSSDLEKLIVPFIYKDGRKTEISEREWQALETDAATLAHIIETLVIVNYSFKLKEINQDLHRFLSSALRHLQNNPVATKDNALILLFSKKTFSFKKFNLFVIGYKLAFIFDLEVDDCNYFMHLDNNFIKNYRALHLENYEYVALVLHYLYRVEKYKGISIENIKAKIANLALKFLEPKFAEKVLPLVLEIEAEFFEKSVQDHLVSGFNLKNFYKFSFNKGPNPHKFMPQPKPELPSTIAERVIVTTENKV